MVAISICATLDAYDYDIERIRLELEDGSILEGGTSACNDAVNDVYRYFTSRLIGFKLE